MLLFTTQELLLQLQELHEGGVLEECGGGGECGRTLLLLLLLLLCICRRVQCAGAVVGVQGGRWTGHWRGAA